MFLIFLLVQRIKAEKCDVAEIFNKRTQLAYFSALGNCIQMYNSHFIGCRSHSKEKAHGGGVLVNNIFDVTITRCSFVDCVAKSTKDSKGGALFLKCKQAVLKNIEGSQCWASDKGQFYWIETSKRKPNEISLLTLSQNFKYSSGDSSTIRHENGFQRLKTLNITNTKTFRYGAALHIQNPDSLYSTESTIQRTEGWNNIIMNDLEGNNMLSFLNIVNNTSKDTLYGLFRFTGSYVMEKCIIQRNFAVKMFQTYTGKMDLVGCVIDDFTGLTVGLQFNGCSFGQTNTWIFEKPKPKKEGEEKDVV